MLIGVMRCRERQTSRVNDSEFITVPIVERYALRVNTPSVPIRKVHVVSCADHPHSLANRSTTFRAPQELESVSLHSLRDFGCEKRVVGNE